MAKISVPVQLSQDTHVRDYLTLLNGILKLTPVELDVLAAFQFGDVQIVAASGAVAPEVKAPLFNENGTGKVVTVDLIIGSRPLLNWTQDNALSHAH